MAGFNKISLIGNLGRDPEMRYTPSGVPVTNFSIAVSRSWKGPDGEPKEETEWFSIECWNKLAEIANQYLQKGKQVYIEGRVSLRTWDDQQTGEKRSQMRVRANDMVMLGSRGEAGASGSDQSGAPDSADLDNMPF